MLYYGYIRYLIEKSAIAVKQAGEILYAPRISVRMSHTFAHRLNHKDTIEITTQLQFRVVTINIEAVKIRQKQRQHNLYAQTKSQY